MNMTINSTNKLVNINGVTARLWEGETNTGLKVSAFIARVAVDQDSDIKEKQQLYEELQKSVPSSTDWDNLKKDLVL